MKHILILLPVALLMLSCTPTDDERAAGLLAKIQSLNNTGHYREALDSIIVLRDRYPKAVEARKAALEVWQSASLKLAQDDVAKTDVLLQQTEQQIAAETDRYRRNMLCVKRDSLKARYEAMCGVVRMIHKRQKQD